MSTFFTSDTHFGHEAIIGFCNRPFGSVEEMDEAMIENWNRVVTDADTVYHIGDFSYRCNYTHARHCWGRLNGHIKFIKGNHDAHLERMQRESNSSMIPLSDYLEIEVEKQRIVMFHYAMRTWHHSLRGVWHLYGHSHNALPPLGRSVDVGVDRWDFTPVSMAQLTEFMDARTGHPDDPGFLNYKGITDRLSAIPDTLYAPEAVIDL